MSMCLQTKDISTLLTFLNSEIEKSTYLVGSSLSFADFFIFSYLSKNIVCIFCLGILIFSKRKCLIK